ncbi:hypothetical protein BegalDRAFT_0282 [Beggiatoa alba B18LD]|uniref:Uncharacterized protein n=1 Tax=Beggiatoa alba B18LD TaxID=395493 RepID=I3CC61_9GAMM|nr:hypothetical protein BegalDRAFT_0282 [Beggiatoa alba B18LD]
MLFNSANSENPVNSDSDKLLFFKETSRTQVMVISHALAEE